MTASQDDKDGAISPVDMIRAVALGCPGVAAMSGTTRTYLPGRTVAGVTMDEHRVDVRIIAQHGPPLPGITERLGNLLFPMLAGRSLHVHIDDLVLPGEAVPADRQLSQAPASAVAAAG